jgi:protein-disulfide isomerase
MLAMGSMPLYADSAKSVGLSATEKKQIEQVVHNYLVEHPEVLVEASQVLQKRQQNEMQAQAHNAIVEHAPAVFTSQLTVEGNPQGNVTLVEFFDYQCIHCKKMQPVVAELVSKNKNLRVVYKEFPIFGKNSEQASAAALAAAMQGKYKALQTALLNIEKPLNEKLVLEAAQSVGLNVEKLKKDMTSKAVKDELAANRTLAEQLHLMGTPAFIIASTPNGQFDTSTKPAFVPGGASEASMQNMINEAVSKK